MKFTIEDLDPFPLNTGLLEKHRPHFEDNVRGDHDSVQKGGNMVDGLVNALESGRVSDRDRVLITEEIRKYKAGEGTLDPFPGVSSVYAEWHDPRLRVLEIMAQKYADSGAAPSSSATNCNALSKRANRSDLRSGQKVRGVDGAIGVITKVAHYVVEIDYGSGHTGISTLDCVELAA